MKAMSSSIRAVGPIGTCLGHYLFLPDYPNRATASRIFQRQFNELLDDTGLKFDPATEMERSVYCLRHTAICMRIILSHR